MLLIYKHILKLIPKLIGELNEASLSTDSTEKKRRALRMAIANNLKEKYVYSESRNPHAIDCVLQNKDDNAKYIITIQQLNKSNNKARPTTQLNRLRKNMNKDEAISISILFQLNHKEFFIDRAYLLSVDDLATKKNRVQYVEINPLEYIPLTDGNELFVKKITTENYKAISTSRSFNFKDSFTVLIGDNAQGKTTILNAIRASLLGILPEHEQFKMDSLKKNIGQNRQIRKQRFYGITEGILRWGDIHSRISTTGELITNDTCTIKTSNNYFSWGAYRLNRKGGVRYSCTSLSESYMRELYQQQMNRSINLPLIVYYSTERIEQANGIRVYAHNDRWSGYHNCLGHYVSYNQFKQWYKDLQLLSNKPDGDYYRQLKKTFIDILKNCFKDERKILDLTYFDTITNVGTGQNEKVDDLVVKRRSEDGENENQILLSNLSAGYKVMLALIADMAMRCLTLNEHLGKEAARETTGIVLIDEIDMHLHPLWQRHIVADLMGCFPKIQFITTTHSPFIVQSLHADQIINLQKNQLDDVYITKDPSILNVNESSRLMGVISPYGSKEAEKRSIETQLYNLLTQESPNKEELKTLINAYKVNNNPDPYFLAHLSFDEKQKLKELGIDIEKYATNYYTK